MSLQQKARERGPVNTKHQTPSSREAPNTKFQAPQGHPDTTALIDSPTARDGARYLSRFTLLTH
ncbi:MAG: hypothetical protein C5B50_02915 [Verrucomicrobia bacterium]|nr:MAG: hypothetical protein C5B50_02915 [Verrucomicrobiota bacterium]